MRIAIGADHNGYALKQVLIGILEQSGHVVRDCGCDGPRSVDYPDVAKEVAEAVSGGQVERGVLICGTGIGMSIAANKVPGIRAALCHSPFAAERAREHNDANILCLAGSTAQQVAQEMAKVFLAAHFDGEKPEGARHAARVAKIARLELSTMPLAKGRI